MPPAKSRVTEKSLADEAAEESLRKSMRISHRKKKTKSSQESQENGSNDGSETYQQECYDPNLSDDEYLYCNGCDKHYVGICPVHGPMVLVVDKKVPKDGTVSQRALKTLPSFLSIGPSGIKNAGLGVWTETLLPPRVVFGPFEGRTMKSRDHYKTGYAWQIWKGGKAHNYVDASDDRYANWMRYINCAEREERQNLIAFQYKKQIYYRTYKQVLPHTELLVWYGNNYAKDLGICLKSTPPPNFSKCHECPKCGVLFTSTEVLESHLKRHPPVEPDDESKYPVSRYPINKSRRFGKNWLKPSEDEPFSCEKCYKTFKTKAGLTQHKSCDPKGKRFRCTQCVKSFSKKQYLVYHMRSHTGEKPHVCSVCEKKFTRSYSLFMHMRSIHLNVKPYACSLCGKTFAYNSHRMMHEKLHSGEKPYKCPKCHQRFAQLNALNGHISHIHTRVFPYNCTVCAKGFVIPTQLRQHMNRSHPGISLYYGSNYVHKCEKCSYSSSVFKDFQNHMLNHTEVNSVDEPVVEIIKERKWKCDRCFFTSSSFEAFENHVLIHKNGPHNCKECNKKFSSNVQLIAHKKTHAISKGYVCCQKVFKVRSSYLRHKTYVHSKVKPFECTFCGKTFAEDWCRRNHEIIHSGVKDHKCPYCDKAFAQPNGVRQHVELMHKEEYAHRCQVCKHGFKTLEKLELHIEKNNHGPDYKANRKTAKYKCDLCPYFTTYFTTLKNHRLTHTDKRPFACNLCPKTFTQKGNLQKHLQVHSDERPFLCNICMKTFRQKAHLQKHDKSHTRSKLSTDSLFKTKKPSEPKSPPEPKSFKCPQCYRRFFRTQALQDHIDLIHSHNFPHECHICKRGFLALTMLEIHMRKSHQGASAPSIVN